MKEEHKNKHGEHKEDNKHKAEEPKKAESQPLGEEHIVNIEVEKLKAELELARKEVAENKDKALRSMADLNNATKRLFKEKEEFIKYASGELAKKLIPMLDDFENALKGEVKIDENFVKGIKLIQKNMKDVFEKEGLKKQEAKGVKFDPNLHEVVATASTEDVKQDGIIAEEFRPGYMFKDIVLRPAMVKIYKLAEKAEEGKEAEKGREGKEAESDKRQATSDKEEQKK